MLRFFKSCSNLIYLSLLLLHLLEKIHVQNHSSSDKIQVTIWLSHRKIINLVKQFSQMCQLTRQRRLFSLLLMSILWFFSDRRLRVYYWSLIWCRSVHFIHWIVILLISWLVEVRPDTRILTLHLHLWSRRAATIDVFIDDIISSPVRPPHRSKAFAFEQERFEFCIQRTPRKLSVIDPLRLLFVLRPSVKAMTPFLTSDTNDISGDDRSDLFMRKDFKFCILDKDELIRFAILLTGGAVYQASWRKNFIPRW